MAANPTQILNFKANFHKEFELFKKKKLYANNVIIRQIWGGHYILYFLLLFSSKYNNNLYFVLKTWDITVHYITYIVYTVTQK